VGAGIDTNGNQYVILLIPCDDNHPGFEDCDYSTVDTNKVTQPAIAPSESHDTPAVGRRGMALNHRRGVLGPRFLNN